MRRSSLFQLCFFIAATLCLTRFSFAQSSVSDTPDGFEPPPPSAETASGQESPPVGEQNPSAAQENSGAGDLLPPLNLDVEKVKEEFIPHTLTADGAVTLNYLFENSEDSFLIKYSFHIKGIIESETAVLKGDAEIRSHVEGFLAKWPTGECKLDITIPKVPFEIIFRKDDETRATINLQFKGSIAETWDSHCSFSSAPGAKFDTKGNPEKWLNEALEKAHPPLNAITMPFNAQEATTASFSIAKQIFQDQPIGTAEVEGTGAIAIRPGTD